MAGPHCPWTSGQRRCGSQVSSSIQVLCLEAIWVVTRHSPQRRGRRAVSWILPSGTALRETSSTWYHTNIGENPDLTAKHPFNKPPPMYFQKELHHEDILLLFIVKPLKSHNVPTVLRWYASYHKSFLFQVGGKNNSATAWCGICSLRVTFWRWPPD